MGADDAIQHFLSLLPSDTAKELTVVAGEKFNPSYLLHISKDTAIPSFSPSVTRRSMDAENRSVPRICTAPTLAGCILGYSSDLFDFIDQPTSTSVDRSRKVEYRGGWAVYGFPVAQCLRPSKKLLPDVTRTDEHWLVTYDEATVSYKPTLLGKFFYEVVSYRAGKGYPVVELEMLVEVGDVPIRFDHERLLTRGYWKLIVKGLHNAERWNKIASVEAVEINRVQYEASKQLVASMLSFEEQAPPSAGW